MDTNGQTNKTKIISPESHENETKKKSSEHEEPKEISSKPNENEGIQVETGAVMDMYIIDAWGIPGVTNKVIYFEPLSKTEEQISNIIFFPGDVQDLEVNMLSKKTTAPYANYSLERTANVLRERYPRSALLLIRAAQLLNGIYASYGNFVLCSAKDMGAAKRYDPNGTACKHLLGLLDFVEDALLQHTGTTSKMQLPIEVVAFSKGVLPLNQLVTELATWEQPPPDSAVPLATPPLQRTAFPTVEDQELSKPATADAAATSPYKVDQRVMELNEADDILPPSSAGLEVDQALVSEKESSETVETAPKTEDESSAAPEPPPIHVQGPAFRPNSQGVGRPPSVKSRRLGSAFGVSRDKSRPTTGQRGLSTQLSGREVDLLLDMAPKTVSARRQNQSEQFFQATFSPGGNVAGSGQERHPAQVLFSRVSAIHWLDGGNAGFRNSMPTSELAVRALGILGVKVALHGTPWQWKDIRRPWLHEEMEAFVRLLTTMAVEFRKREYFYDLAPVLKKHFEIISVYDTNPWDKPD